MATPANANGLLVFWDEANKEIEPHIKDKKSEYRGQDYKPNMWHSMCTTWDSTSGLVQLWFDGIPLMKKYSSAGSNIRGSTIIILGQVSRAIRQQHGFRQALTFRVLPMISLKKKKKCSWNASHFLTPQEQDSHGGGFDIKQSFVGMMSDVHMWDYVLSPCEIHNYMDDLNFTPGNLINWRALDFQIRDRVLIESKMTGCERDWTSLVKPDLSACSSTGLYVKSPLICCIYMQDAVHQE